jgi:trk system potassium uptake protein TrkA
VSTTRITVVGLGAFGTALARSMARMGATVVAIDTDMVLVDRIKNEVDTAVRLDATDREALAARSVHEVDVAVICMGEDFVSAELCAVHLLELGCPRVMVRGTSDERVQILTALGAEVITPTQDEARQLAVGLMGKGVLDYASLAPGSLDLALVEVPPGTDGKTLADLGLGAASKAKVVALRRGAGEAIFSPGQSTEVRPGDHLFLLGDEADLVRATRQLR